MATTAATAAAFSNNAPFRHIARQSWYIKRTFALFNFNLKQCLTSSTFIRSFKLTRWHVQKPSSSTCFLLFNGVVYTLFGCVQPFYAMFNLMLYISSGWVCVCVCNVYVLVLTVNVDEFGQHVVIIWIMWLIPDGNSSNCTALLARIGRIPVCHNNFCTYPKTAWYFDSIETSNRYEKLKCDRHRAKNLRTQWQWTIKYVII